MPGYMRRIYFELTTRKPYLYWHSAKITHSTYGDGEILSFLITRVLSLKCKVFAINKINFMTKAGYTLNSFHILMDLYTGGWHKY